MGLKTFGAMFTLAVGCQPIAPTKAAVAHSAERSEEAHAESAAPPSLVQPTCEVVAAKVPKRCVPFQEIGPSTDAQRLNVGSRIRVVGHLWTDYRGSVLYSYPDSGWRIRTYLRQPVTCTSSEWIAVDGTVSRVVPTLADALSSGISEVQLDDAVVFRAHEACLDAAAVFDGGVRTP